MKYKFMIVVFIAFALGTFSSCYILDELTSSESPVAASESPVAASESPVAASESSAIHASLTGIWKYADEDLIMTFFFKDSNYEITTIEKLYRQSRESREYLGEEIITFAGTYEQTDSEILLTLTSGVLDSEEVYTATSESATFIEYGNSHLLTPEEVEEFLEYSFPYRNMTYSIVKGYSSQVLRVKIMGRPYELVQL